MRQHWTVTAAAITLLATAAAASADEIKQVPYPEVKVQVPELFKADAGFQKMQKTLMDAIESKNAQAVASLVGPSFVWTQDWCDLRPVRLWRRRVAEFQGGVRVPRGREARRRRRQGRAILGNTVMISPPIKIFRR